jgi:hypothetical protein
MQPDNEALYMKKLKESIEINQALLSMEGDMHKGLNALNQQFQAVLQKVFEHSQASLPFFEGITAKLTEEENQVLVQHATATTAAHQQFFALWKASKDLETKSALNLSVSAEKIKAFAEE